MDIRNVFHLTGEIVDNSLAKWLLKKTLNEEEQCDLLIVINSCGGDLLASLEAISIMNRSQRKVITLISGSAESAALLISVSGHKRLVFEESLAMSHTLSISFEGSYNEVKDLQKYNDILNERMLTILSSKSNQTRSFLSKNIVTDKDYWMESSELFKLGLVDKVIGAKETITNIIKEL